MVPQRAFESTMFIEKIFQMLPALSIKKDYERAKQRVTERIVRRQSRGNVVVQDRNGWYMTPEELRDKSRNADKSVSRLRNSVDS